MSTIKFKINGKQYEADERYGPDVTLNYFIRTEAHLRGSKSMCQEGGCGACIVSVKAASPPNNEVKTFAVNSCLVSILSCHGWEITTVEGIGDRLKGYHEIQTRLAKYNGTQCGYCTPGWVMNFYSIYTANNGKLTAEEIENSFAGNMCRCTGYRSIADAFKSFATDVEDNTKQKLKDIEDLDLYNMCGKINKENINCSDKLNEWCVVEKMCSKALKIEAKKFKWSKVYNLDQAFKAISNSSSYKLIAGNTGQGVYHVKEYPENVIDISNVTELKGYTQNINLVLGAGMTIAEMMELFIQLSNENSDFAYLKEFYKHLDLVAHIPIRNIGTIGGNLYLKYLNKDFQSDLFVLFETVGAVITIVDGSKEKVIVSLVDFLETDLKGKIILSVALPPLPACCHVKTFKIMPRSQNSHAAVNAGFCFHMKPDSSLIDKITIVFGGLSTKFIHATKTENILKDKELFTNDNVQEALSSLFDEIEVDEAPTEPSTMYRKMLAVALFYKAILALCPEESIDKKFKSGGNVIKRLVSKGTQVYETDQNIWPLNQPIPKIEALAQCSGEAVFANDLPKQMDEVYAAFVTADIVPGSIIKSFDTSEAMNIPGVTAFYSSNDIPGENNFTPLLLPLLFEKEEVLCTKTVKFYGQPAGIIVANREKLAHQAAKLVKIEYEHIESKTPLLSILDVLNSDEKEQRVKLNKVVESSETGSDVKIVIQGELNLPSQYHYTMEPQTCVTIPTEEGMEVYSATQWLDGTNTTVAKCLNVPINRVNVIVRRVGGGYGGKISRSCQVACATALVSHFQDKTCRFVLPLQENMKIVGKRAPTYCKFEVGVNEEGKIQYLKNQYYQDLGCSENEIMVPVTMMHCASCYDTKRWTIEGYTVLTDIPSTTWCRAPASMEGVAITEYIMEKIAHTLKKDPMEVRLLNMSKENNPIPKLIVELKVDADYEKREEDIQQFNKDNRWRKRALKIMPLTYELFYLGPFNSLVSIYHEDGTVSITHGATEMGQGVNTKVAQVCGYTLGISLDKISVKPSSTLTSPNCMVTGGSIGSECAAYATMKACEIILERLKPIRDSMDNPTWEELIKKAHNSSVYLQASYLYTINEPVKPYEIYAVVALEVEVDILTGNHDVRRVDLLEDTGRSLSPEIDIGQIEGAFVMGLGYWTSEKLIYDKSTGQLLTNRTWNYKPPGIKDIPEDFRVYFRRNSSNISTGEPASCLATVIIHAFRQAVLDARKEAGYEDEWIDIENPCTIENIFMSVGHKLEHFKLNE